jgi:thiopeptide-type bacteriocin biosynthesis protein
MEVKRTFIIGDSWLYYKVYCGVRSSDKILLEVIKPLVAMLKEENIINQWFSIRYNDPDYHLRIRFHLNDTALLGKLVSLFNKAITPYLKSNFVSKIQIDTYNREIERYGANCMLFSEQLFNYQSDKILGLIEVRENDNHFFLEVLLYIDTLLNNFELTIDEKLRLASQNATSFKTEFEVDKNTNTQLYKKHNTLNAQFISLLKNTTKNITFEELAIIDKIKNLDNNKNTLLSSYIHMFVNRAFRSKQRFFELVCYDFLTRFYKTEKYSK